VASPKTTKRFRRRSSAGFTLVEVAIVVLILALILAGVLVSGRLLESSRTKRLLADVEHLKAGYFGFFDRYHGLPGDYPRATTDIPLASVDGDGNGKIQSIAGGAPVDEHIALWEHLSRSGFVRDGFVYAPGPEQPSSAPKTPFGGYPRFVFGPDYGGLATPRNALHTGNLIPAAILAEADQKIDEGTAYAGTFRYSPLDTAGNAPAEDRCVFTSGADQGRWRQAETTETNCGAAWLF
jgi:prepilin-type N-terminal cleavage/methylation domain-containing protein